MELAIGPAIITGLRVALAIQRRPLQLGETAKTCLYVIGLGVCGRQQRRKQRRAQDDEMFGMTHDG